MLTRNNKGEVVGEMNMSITQDGTIINTNTLYTTEVLSLRTSPSATARAMSARRM